MSVSPKKGRLAIRHYEMWSFVKGNKPWIWLALDVVTREIVGVYVGNRGEHGAFYTPTEKSVLFLSHYHSFRQLYHQLRKRKQYFPGVYRVEIEYCKFP